MSETSNTTQNTGSETTKGMPQPAEFSDLLPDLHAGVFAQKINRALADVALGVVTNGKKGEVTIKLTMKQIGESNQIAVEHQIAYVQPTKRGQRSEKDTTETPLHVGPGGRLSIYPTPESGDLFGKEGPTRG